MVFESTIGETYQKTIGENYFFNSVSTNEFCYYCSLCLETGYDVVWVRGGFKNWIPFIEEVKRKKKWLLFYGANTGNERWPFWDVILDDLDPVCKVIDDRIYYPYLKPINQDVFYYDKEIVSDIDVCIGASNIHDKKGQYLGFEVVKQYERTYDEKLNWIMPGALRRGVNTNKMIEDMGLEDRRKMTGSTSREQLANLFRRTKVFLHLGTGGQADRGPMEAMACGCAVIIRNEKRFPPYFCWCCSLGLDLDITVKLLRYYLISPIDKVREEKAKNFKSIFGVDDYMEYFRILFDYIFKNSVNTDKREIYSFL